VADSRARRIGLAGLAAIVVALLALVVLTGGDDHRTLRATFGQAPQVVTGQEVRIAGRKVGSVQSVKEVDGQAVVTMAFGAGDWPLHRGTVARVRYGSLSGYAGRFIDLRPGPRSAPALADGAVLGIGQTITQTEFDELWNTFDATTRRNLQGTLDGAADLVGPRGAELGRSLQLGGPGVEGLAGLMADLGHDPAALQTLVRAGARTTAELRRQEPALRELLPRAAGTFEELAGRAREQQAALERLPATLRIGRSTLARLDASVTGLRALVTDLRPGARALQLLAPTATRTIRKLHAVAPLATRTLVVGRRNAPAISRFLRAATPVLPRVASILDRAAPAVGCIRPYAPEITGTLVTWAGLGSTDPLGLNGRANLTQLPPLVGAGTPASASEITRLYRNRISYAMPRPPGLDSGKPWFQPQCGAGPDALDPAKDPER
jgi:ABC-type transporter Mla subunit MlaD